MNWQQITFSNDDIEGTSAPMKVGISGNCQSSGRTPPEPYFLSPGKHRKPAGLGAIYRGTQ